MEHFNQIKILNIIYWAIFGGIIILSIVVYVLVEINGPFMTESSTAKIYIYVFIGLVLVFHFLSNLVFRKNLAKINQNDSLDFKLKNYQQSIILKAALLEAEGIMVLALVLITGNYLFFILMLIIFLTFINNRNRPTLDNIARELNLSQEEIHSIQLSK